jgi:hypothetical protein
MNLIGSRITLIANLCALFVASVVAVEGAYILSKSIGYVRPSNVFDAFLPAFVMFIIRISIFSWCFLLLYAALAVQMFYEAQLIFRGLYSPGVEDPLGYQGLFILVATGCLAIYALLALVWFVNSFFASNR